MRAHGSEPPKLIGSPASTTTGARLFARLAAMQTPISWRPFRRCSLRTPARGRRRTRGVAEVRTPLLRGLPRRLTRVLAVLATLVFISALLGRGAEGAPAAAHHRASPQRHAAAPAPDSRAARAPRAGRPRI